ncbi:diguanylate cyclase [Halobacillus seohaensis]|uniref:Diguanylate cyclase n=1 Tax=Halobacillus seohaensis TaxID=447421 RepID=A0ABW2EH95_9BACI
MVNMEEFILNASLLITIIYLAAFLHKKLLVNVKSKIKEPIYILIAIGAGWTSMSFGIHLADSVIFDLRFIPIIIVSLYAKNPFHILAVGIGIGLLRLTFGISEAAFVGFLNMVIVSITGLLLHKQLQEVNSLGKIITVVVTLNLVNAFVIATLGVIPIVEYLILIMPTALPLSIVLSLLLVWMVKDLAEEFSLKRDLTEKASRDPLTKLYNRRAFMRYLEDYTTCDVVSSPLGLSLIDIDYFKEVNDTHGHVTGDLVLQKMSQLFTENLRTIDVIARYGGEEFIVLLPNCSKQDGEKAMERVREAIEKETFQVNGLDIETTISIGVATTTDVELDDLILAADEALYEAKHKGRNRVECYPIAQSEKHYGLDKKVHHGDLQTNK